MAGGERISILFVEDSEADLELTLAALRDAGLDVDYERVDSEATLREALARRPWQLVISDFAMPGFNGLHALDIVLNAGLDLPFIFVSGVLGEERAVAAMRAGARDYVLKDNLARLGPAARREIAESKNRSRRAIAEEALRVEQLRYRKIFDSAAIGLLVVDAAELKASGGDGGPARPQSIAIRDANDEARRLLEHEGEEVVLGELARILRPAASVHTELAATITGQVRRYLVSGRGPGLDDDWSFLVISILDVTERWRLEQSLSKAQRMEALGRLAGGVAHDFNNLLTVISSTARFIGEAVPAASPAGEDVAMVLDASQRAAGLTRQLLAFSRDEPYNPVVVDPNEAIQRVHRMLSRIIEAHVDFGLHLGRDIASVLIDPLQLDQVLLNLVMNARDAMPSGGTLRISTSMEHPPQPNGEPFVCIRVTDTGHGMDATTRAHIFEPFFTSKPPGLGTGLGLAIVFGVVSRHGGQLDVTSAVGAGATFAVYLPMFRGQVEAEARVAPGRLVGDETILVVEDHDLVRRTTQRILEQAGYSVLVAASGGAALASLDGSPRHVDLVVSDLVMPGMNGLELRRAVEERYPRVSFLLTSAYSGAALTSTPLPEGVAFLSKPFSAHELLSKVRAVLQSRDARS